MGLPLAALSPCPRSAGERVDLVNDGGGFAVIFASGHDALILTLCSVLPL
jgi:hypothetical protein